MAQPINFAEIGVGVVEPQARIKLLVNYGYIEKVDANIPIRRYFRSGMEMVRMANVYLQEGHLENAYTLYLKLLTLFLEKIQSHPEYKVVPANIKAELNVVLPISEQLKLRLLDRYQKEYDQFLAQKELDKANEASKVKPKNVPSSVKPDIATTSLPQPTAPIFADLDQVVYPNDFPSDPVRSNLPSGLLLPDSDPKRPKPAFDRSLKPSVSLVEGGLRPVIVPMNTMEQFLNLARSNTTKDVETCGILAGRLAHNQLIITHVIVPKQKGTSDSCTTMNEEEIFDIQDARDLITLGWIHTHPSQTAFLSSVDLHTHCSYQMMMPEALAIVCAPKYKTTGYFCLTPSYGLDYIARCRQSGFHPHPNDPPLFMEASHIVLDNKARIEVIDLRR